jgi:PEGA domain
MRGRLCCVIAAVLLASSAGSAQDGLRSASLPERTPQQPIPPPPTDLYRVPPDTYMKLRPRIPRYPGTPHYPIYGYGSYLTGAPETPSVDRYEPARSGFLDLQMQPGSAQVYVDGFYMGAVDDFRRMIPGRPIEAGPHRVELRAPGYDTATFNVMIPPNETVTYRASLNATAPAAPVVALPPAPPKTFYVIPGCYAGDKPPRARLPRGCDRSKLRAIPPQPVFSARR